MAELLHYDGTLYRGFYIFFDSNNEFAVIPQPWVQSFGDRVTRTAVFHDESKNRFNIAVTREGVRMAFTRGITLLLDHYNQDRGAFARVFYLGGSEFHVQMMNRELVPVKDFRTWPRIYEFGWNSARRIEDPYDSDIDDNDWDNLFYSDIEICTSHFVKNMKSLPIPLVREAIFPKTPPFCVLRDQHKGRYFCEYQFRNNGTECTLTTGWLEFVFENNLNVDNIVRLGIKRGDPSIVHARVLRNAGRHGFKIEKKLNVNDAKDTPMRGCGTTVGKFKIEPV